MGRQRQLTSRDVVFVGGETANIHQHTSGLTILDATGRPDFGFETFSAHMVERLSRIPHLHWKLHEVPLGLDLPYWVEDEQFSFDNHIRRVGCPKPADNKALAELVAYLYSRHLDRSRPLWEMWFIDGLEGDQFALFTKLHHSMMDGEGAAILARMICDLEPDAAPSDVEPAIASALPGEVPDLWQQASNAVRHLSGLPVRVGQEVIDGARHALSSRAPSDDEPVEQKRVPVAGFNCAISSDRGFVYGSLPLAEIKALKDHFGVTVNDVVLSLVAGSLRTYLLKRGELPEDSLRCGFAVSLRSRDDEEFSNRVTTASATLATTVADPVERLRVITDEAEAAKKVARSGGKGFLELVGILPPLAVGPLLSMAPASVLPRIAGYNLLVSSLRGSPIQLYMGGASVTAMYPMSIIVPGGGLNVTCMSYTDHIDFGLTLEPSALPDPWNIISGLEESLSEYMALLP